MAIIHGSAESPGTSSGRTNGMKKRAAAHQQYHHSHRVGEIASTELGKLGQERRAGGGAKQQQANGMPRLQWNDPAEHESEQRREDEIDRDRQHDC